MDVSGHFKYQKMTPEETVQYLGTRSAKIISEGKGTVENLYMPLALLYHQMLGTGEITALKDVGGDKMLKWWTQACMAEMDAPRYKKIWRLQAIYMYWLITEVAGKE
jgi:hypothetical protein